MCASSLQHDARAVAQQCLSICRMRLQEQLLTVALRQRLKGENLQALYFHTPFVLPIVASPHQTRLWSK